jgi:hypothetical protein
MNCKSIVIICEYENVKCNAMSYLKYCDSGYHKLHTIECRNDIKDNVWVCKTVSQYYVMMYQK